MATVSIGDAELYYEDSGRGEPLLLVPGLSGRGSFWVNQVTDLARDFRLNEAAYRHPAALADGVEVAAVLAGWTDAGRSAVLEELQSLDVPRYPIRGEDLIRLGMKPGKGLGDELARLEQLWIESRFTLDREELLEKVRRG